MMVLAVVSNYPGLVIPGQSGGDDIVMMVMRSQMITITPDQEVNSIHQAPGTSWQSGGRQTTETTTDIL